MTGELFEIPPRSWSTLRDLYADHKLYSSSFNTLQMCIDWCRQNKEISKDVKIYTLDANWQTDGTFVIWDNYQLIGNTLSEDLERLTLTLEAAECLGAKGTLVFNGFRERVLPAARDFFFKTGRVQPCRLLLCYYVEPEIIRHYDVTPPLGYSVAKLQVKHAAVVSSNWPFSSPAANRYIERLIRYNDSVGAFDRSGKLVAWCLYTALGSLGLTQVLEGHKRLGLGSLVVRCIAKMLMARGIQVTAPVLADNPGSQMMFEKLGFHIVDHMFWAYENPTKGKHNHANS